MRKNIHRFFGILIFLVLFFSVLYPSIFRKRFTDEHPLNNPADPESETYQGYKTESPAQEIIILNKTNLFEGFESNVSISNYGWQPLMYSVGFSSYITDTSQMEDMPESRIFNIAFNLEKGEHYLYFTFLLPDSTIFKTNASFLFDVRPQSPEVLFASRGEYIGEVRLSWSAVSYADDYQVYKGLSLSNMSAISTWISNTNYIDLSVTNGVSYYYGVKSRSGGYESRTPTTDIGYIGSVSIAQKKSWTIMLYIDGDNNLEKYAIEDVNEIELGLNELITANSNAMSNLNVILILDRAVDVEFSQGYTSTPTESTEGDWTSTRMYKILPDTSDTIFGSERLDDGKSGQGHVSTLGEKNMASISTLTWFIRHCQDFFPASNYALILWNHGAGARKIKNEAQPFPFAKEICVDEASEDDALYLDELQECLSNRFTSSNKLSILGFDACLMGMVEIAYEVSPYCNYMVASMHTEQADGWNYKSIFASLTNTRAPSVLTGDAFGEILVEKYRDFIGINNLTGETMALTSLSNMEELKTDINLLARMVYQNGEKIAFQNIRDASVHFYDDDSESIVYPFYDLYDLCVNIETNTNFSFSTRGAATGIISKMGEVMLASYGDTGNGQNYYYETGTNAKRGLSIVIPRGEKTYVSSGQTNSHYAYQWWYSKDDLYAIYPSLTTLSPPGKIDFCEYTTDGYVRTWWELFNAYYALDSGYTNTLY